MTEQNTIWVKIQEVNAMLLAGEPGNISEDTHSGFCGYDPQAIKDAMNAVFGPGQWGCKELSSDIEITKTKNGEGALVVAKVEVWIAGVEYRPDAWGQCRVINSEIGDARKGAKTDAMKKALSDFSVGNRAYLGLLPKPPKENRASAPAQTAAARERAQTYQSAPASNGQRAASAPAQAARPERPAPAAPASASQETDTAPSEEMLKKIIAANPPRHPESGASMDWAAVLAYIYRNAIIGNRTTLEKLVSSPLSPSGRQAINNFLLKSA